MNIWEKWFKCEQDYKGKEFIWLKGVFVLSKLKCITSIYLLSIVYYQKKKLLWEELATIKKWDSNDICCMMGDFNTIRTQDERKEVGRQKHNYKK